MKQSALPLDKLPPQVLLADRHYLGPSHRSTLTIEDDFGVMVFAAPTARNVPKTWLELVRWCLHGDANAGSQQWRIAKERLVRDLPLITTVVSYSDPSVGHTGALYRACNWLWAPTWHRLFPSPSGHGKWSDKAECVKDRWVAVLRPDASREAALAVRDTRIKRIPWAEYREPKWKRGKAQLAGAGGDYHRFMDELQSVAKQSERL